MPRTIASSTLTKLQSTEFVLTHLLKLDLDTPLYLTENPFDIDFDGNTYDANASLVGVGSVTESTDLKVGQINISFSGADTSTIQTIIGQNIINRKLQIWKVVVNDETGAITGDPIPTFTGYITSFRLDESPPESTVSINAASHWADFNKKNGRFTNNNSQQNIFSGDLGMEYAANTIKDLKWGNA